MCDHASAEVPDGIALGVPPEILAQHMAVDLGAGPLVRALGEKLGAPGWLASWSRLVCDLNRAPDAAGLIPTLADGHEIPGNRDLTPAARAERLQIHDDFHGGLRKRIEAQQPKLLLSVHSFTPKLHTGGAPRPWPIGILWNQDMRAARSALQILAQGPDLGGPVGANEPYSGKVLNYTMNRHGETNGIPYVGVEIRQDLLVSDADIGRWANILAQMTTQILMQIETGQLEP